MSKTADWKLGQDGWGHCGHHRFHFFRNGFAVCNRNFRSGRAVLDIDRLHAASDDCKRCRYIRDGELLNLDRAWNRPLPELDVKPDAD